MLRDFFIILPMLVCLFWIVMILSGKSKKSTPASFLLWLYVMYFLIFLGYPIYIGRITEVMVYYNYVFILSLLSVYPLFYTYVRLLTGVGRWKPTMLFAVFPAIFLTLVALAASVFMSDGEMMAYLSLMLYRIPSGYEFSIFGKIRFVLFYVNVFVFYAEMVLFTVLIVRKLIAFRRKVINYYSDGEDKFRVLSMVLYVTIVFVTIITSFVSTHIIYFVRLSDSQIILVSTIYSALLFFIGTYSVRPVFTGMQFLKDISEEQHHRLPEKFRAETYEDDSLCDRIIRLFQEKEIYLNPELRITDVSDVLNTNRTYISNAINSGIGHSFSDFVNYYRVEHAKRLLRNKDARSEPLISIAEQSGFYSVNSFYRAFRRFEGVSPKQYMMRNA